MEKLFQDIAEQKLATEAQTAEEEGGDQEDWTPKKGTRTNKTVMV